MKIKKFPKKIYKNYFDYFDEYNNFRLNLLNLNKKKFTLVEKLFFKTLLKNKNFYFLGNGGSAATSDHAACDFSNQIHRFTRHKSNFLSLCGNTALITAIGNDMGYKYIFSKQISKLLSKGDLVIVFSVSGNSQNILEAIKVAKNKKIKVISFTGFNGGAIKKISDLNINIECKNYGIVEDMHMQLMHSLSQYLRLKITKTTIKYF